MRRERESGGQVFSIPVGGSLHKVQFACDGSGRAAARSSPFRLVGPCTKCSSHATGAGERRPGLLHSGWWVLAQSAVRMRRERESGGQVFSIPVGGSLHKVQFACDGSG